MLVKISKFLQSVGLIIVLALTLCGGFNTSNIVVQAGGPIDGNQWPNYFPVNKTIIVDKSKITALSPNLNSDKTKNRINLFFYRSTNEIPAETLKNLIIGSIKTSKPVNYFTRDYGIFDTEPMRTHMDKFNFWFFEDLIPQNDKSPFETAIRENPMLTELDFILPVSVEKRPEYSPDGSLSARESASLPNLAYNNDHTQITEYLPGSVTMYYDSYIKNSILTDSFSNNVLLHELGHAAFGLADEYSEPGSSELRISYPNCASRVDQAKIWWGDNLGKVDPFFYEYRDNLIQSAVDSPDLWLRYNNGQLQASYQEDPTIPDSPRSWRNITKNEIIDEEEFRVRLTNKDGCFSDKPDNGALRPTNESIMISTYTPIFGSVNRTVSEQILNLFNKPTLPPRYKNFTSYYEDIKNFQQAAISPGDCQVVIQDAKKTLNCNFENQNNMMSDKIVISYGLKEFDRSNASADDGYGFDPRVTKTATCKLSSDVLKFVCEGLDITNLDPSKEYLLGLSYDATQVFQSSEDPYNNGIAGGSIFYTTKSANDEYPFKYTILDTKIIEEIKPIITPTTPSVITPIVASIPAPTPIQKITPVQTVSVLAKTGTSLSNLIISLILVTISTVLLILKTNLQTPKSNIQSN